MIVFVAFLYSIPLILLFSLCFFLIKKMGWLKGMSRGDFFLLVPLLITLTVVALFVMIPCEGDAGSSYSCLGSEDLGDTMFMAAILTGFIIGPLSFTCLIALGVKHIIKKRKAS